MEPAFDTDDQTPHKVMVVVGRFPDVSNFADAVGQYLYDNFDLIVAQPLEEDDDRDFQGNLRFIGFVTGTEIGGMTLDNQAMAIKSSGGVLGAEVYATMERAMDDAKERLGFDNGGAALAERVEMVQDIVNRFTKFDVDELQFGTIFQTLAEAGRLRMIRGLIDDEPVMVMALITTDDDHGMRINPMAVLLTGTKLPEMLELPFSAFE